MATVDIYIRVSRIGGRENLISPDEQERRARMLAVERGLTVGEVLIDLDESGGKWDRPGLQTALKRVEQGASQGIVVAWLDRLSRDSEHAHRLVRQISDGGGKVYAPDAPADWTTPEGELQAGLLFAFAAYVRSRARAGFERAKQQAIENGIPVHTRPPVGYRARDDRRLEPDPATADVIRQVYDARVRGAGPVELAAILETAGVTTSQGSATWSKQAVYGLLRNRVYLGELAYGRDRRFVNAASHEPLVDQATWELAQGGVGHARPRAHLLSGLLRCDGCGYCLQATADSHGSRIYRCGRRHAGGICPRPARIRADRVEELVVADMWANLPKLRASGRRDASGDLVALAEFVARERRALEEWADPQVQVAVGDQAVYLAGLRERRERVGVADARLAAERRLQEAADAVPHAVTWEGVWAAASVPERAGLLAHLYDCVRLGRNPDVLVVYPVGFGPAGLPRRGFRRDPGLRPFDGDVPDGARVLAL